MEKKKLNNNINIPTIGYGTWRIPDGEVAVNTIKTAIKYGYRHIDTAAIYKNEVSVGKAIKESKLNREDLFITSKVWNTERGYKKTIEAFNKTLLDLQLDYLDLYLIHWPANKKQYSNFEEINLDTWNALISLYKEGKIKAIGVSNFKPHHLDKLINSEIPPMVNQIEFHPGMRQIETINYCKKHNIIVEAWSPLGRGKLLDNLTLIEIAKKYNKSVAQICIRWCLQHDVIPLPKSVTPTRIKENLEVFDFNISDEDMKTIDKLDNIGGSNLDPDEIDF